MKVRTTWLSMLALSLATAGFGADQEKLDAGLIKAAAEGATRKVESLLEAGANVNAKGEWDYTRS